MTTSRFFSSLLGTAALSAALLLGLGELSTYESFTDLGWLTMAVFSVLSIVVFLLTQRLQHSKKKTRLVSLILMNMLLKMVLSAVIVAGYFVTQAPDDGLFIIPFLLIYVIYTVFETYFMNEQARAS